MVAVVILGFVKVTIKVVVFERTSSYVVVKSGRKTFVQ